MRPLDNVSWDECIRTLRRAGFVPAAESPSKVMLVSAGKTVLLQRVAILDETILQDALRSAGLSEPRFRALLAEGVAEALVPSSPVPSPRRAFGT